MNVDDIDQLNIDTSLWKVKRDKEGKIKKLKCKREFVMTRLTDGVLCDPWFFDSSVPEFDWGSLPSIPDYGIATKLEIDLGFRGREQKVVFDINESGCKSIDFKTQPSGVLNRPAKAGELVFNIGAL